MNYIPEHLIDSYTLNGKIPILYDYHDESNYHDNYDVNACLELIKKAKHREIGGYGETDRLLYQAFSEHLKNKQNILIFGSQIPWYESICKSYDIQKIVVSEYCKINRSMYQYIHPNELETYGQKFYNFLSISSFEHDGLGRYGDLLNPNADLETMKKIRDYLCDSGLLFLSIPIGKDTLVWNAHRIYGSVRLPMLLEGWSIISEYGFNEKHFQLSAQDFVQPIFVLKKII